MEEEEDGCQSKHVSDVEFILLDRHIQAGFIVLITGRQRQQMHALHLSTSHRGGEEGLIWK